MLRRFVSGISRVAGIYSNFFCPEIRKIELFSRVFLIFSGFSPILKEQWNFTQTH